MIQGASILDEITKTHVFFDVFKIYLNYKLKQWELDTVESLCGSFNCRLLNMQDGRFRKIDQQMFARGFRQSLSCMQPSEDALKFLISRLDSSNYTITYVELAIDWIMPNRKKAMALHQFIESRLRKSYHRKKHAVNRFYSITTKNDLIEEHLTTYIGGKNNGAQFTIYSGLPSRHFVNASCSHAEYRIQNSKNVKRLGISTVSDLLLFNHAAFWSKRLRLFEIDKEKLGKLIHRTHLNTKPRIIKRGRYTRNVDKFTGAQILRLCLYENDLMDNDITKTGPIGQTQFTALKEHVKKYGLDLKLDKVLSKVEVTKLLENAEHPQVLARTNSITM